MLLGCIGDDFTGSSDLASTLAKGGMRVTQYTGIPDVPAEASVEAGVIALKSRSIAPADAVAQSLAALKWLQAQGCEQFLFKYCSTFDSTPEGNIGPVAEALADALDAHKVIVCPAFPGTGRSIYMGHLFVNDTLLSESGMENHPLTPMTDPDLRRWLAPQTRLSIGHISTHDIHSDTTSQALAREHENGNRLIVADAIGDEDLIKIGRAAADLPLITGGSGIALGLPENFRTKGKIGAAQTQWTPQKGKCAILSGSCSIATRGQLEEHLKSNPGVEIKAEDVLDGTLTPAQITEHLLTADSIPVAYSSADPDVIRAVQSQFGQEKSAQAIEEFFAETARLLTSQGVTRLITAGGETSGAVVEGLRLNTLEIGPEIDPGVPALRASSNLTIALKSGNFGAPDFFAKAAKALGHD